VLVEERLPFPMIPVVCGPLSASRTLRVVDVRDDDADQPPVLVVEDMAG
jgi:hypothetical protein